LAVHDPAQAPVTAAVARHRIELREILYCTDFSGYSNQACGYALSIAEEYGARITLFHVVEGIFRSRLRKTTEKAYASLRRLVSEDAQRDERTAFVVRSGSPYRQICQLAAERNVDLIVMAVRGRNALDEAVFGSTTYRVVLMAGRPVLAVHP
jgi:universal stress protein A